MLQYLGGGELLRGAHGEVAAGFSALGAVGDADVGPHAAQHVDDGVASGVQSHIRQCDFAALHDGGCHQPERRAGNIPRHGDILVCRNNRSLHGDVQPVCRDGAGDAEVLEQALRVVSGDGRLVHGGAPPGQHAGQQHGALHLGAGHGQVVVDGAQGAALNLQRGAAGLLAAGGDPGSHGGQRVDDAFHRAAAQRGIAEHAAAEGEGCQHTRHEAHAGAAVAAVDIVGGGGGLHARAGEGEVLPAIARGDGGAQLLHGAQGIDAVFAAQVVAHLHGAAAEGAENGHAVGDTLISRYGDSAAQSASGAVNGDAVT